MKDDVEPEPDEETRQMTVFVRGVDARNVIEQQHDQPGQGQHEAGYPHHQDHPEIGIMGMGRRHVVSTAPPPLTGCEVCQKPFMP